MTFDTATVDGGAGDVTGFTIDSTDASGGIHKHINFFMLDDNDLIAGIEEGIYVVGLRLEQLLAKKPEGCQV